MSVKKRNEIIESITSVVIYENGICAVCFLPKNDFYKLDTPCINCLVNSTCVREANYGDPDLHSDSERKNLVILNSCEKIIEYFADAGCLISSRARTSEFENWKIRWSADFNKF